MQKRWSTVVALAAVLSLLAGCGSDEAELVGLVRTPPLEAGELTLRHAETGASTPLAATDGELNIVYFGYTQCPDVCPTTMFDIKNAIGNLSDSEAERVTVALATVDPERDTAEVLSGYLGHFADEDSALPLRTEDVDELNAVTSTLGVQWQVEEHEPGDRAYDVAHSAITYVINSDGTVLVEWPFGFDSDAMTADLKILLEREQLQ